MPVVKPVKLLVKDPITGPLIDVLLFAMVGLDTVLQQMPLNVISDPPFELILPPLSAEVLVIEVAAVVANVGNKFPLRPLNAGKLICANPLKESSVKNNM